MKNYLALDTSSGIRVLLSVDGKNYDYTEDDGKSASAVLLPVVDKLLSKAGVQLKDLDAIAVVVGPGSFTGIRIAVNTARMFAYTTQIPLIKVDNLEVCASGIKGECNSVVYGWGKNFYTAKYVNSIPISQAVAQTYEFVNGLENIVCDKKSKKFLPTAIESGSAQDLRVCVERKLKNREFTKAEEVIPFYIASSQAENDLAKKEGK